MQAGEEEERKLSSSPECCRCERQVASLSTGLPHEFLGEIKWTMQLGRDHSDLEPMMKGERGWPYLTVRVGQAEQTLTTQGYKETIMTEPKAGEKLTIK